VQIFGVQVQKLQAHGPVLQRRLLSQGPRAKYCVHLFWVVTPPKFKYRNFTSVWTVSPVFSTWDPESPLVQVFNRLVTEVPHLFTVFSTSGF
jgi:hypothetical protein